MKSWIVWACVCTCLLGAAVARAITPEETRQAFDEARQVAKSGPQDIALDTQAVLRLPAAHVYIGQPHATKLLNAMGNPGHDPRLQGLIFPQGDAPWFMTVRFEPAGYIKDDDAKDWKADALLQSFREGTEEANAERLKMGVPAIEILGWAEKPAYDAATQRLVWAMASRDKGAAADQPQGVNYNTYVLGREGYFSMNLVTDLKDLPAYKGAAQTLLAALNFNEGKRYADFNASTDKVAEYGLAALVVGAAAKKLGVLAVIAAFFAKFAKIIILALAGVGALFYKFFRRGSAKAAPPAA